MHVHQLIHFWRRYMREERFLADRTNGRAYATVLRPSVVCRRRLWRYVL